MALAGGTALSYYVEALWFVSLGYSDVFWKTLNLQSAVFTLFSVATFAALYGSFRALQPAAFGPQGSAGVFIVGAAAGVDVVTP